MISKNYTQAELDRYIDLRRKLEGFGLDCGLNFELTMAHQKLERHQVGNDLDKFMKRTPEHDADARAWVELSNKVSIMRKEVRELEEKIIFGAEISPTD